MIVLDTHAWLWLIDSPSKLSRAATRAIDAADRIGVSTMSCWEVAMLVSSSRIRLDRDVRLWVRQALAAERVEPVGLSVDTALEAALLPPGFAGDPADRIIYATAAQLGARLVTRDDRLSAYDPTRVIW